MKSTLLLLVYFLLSSARASNQAVLNFHHLETSVNPLLDGQHAYPDIIKLPHVEFPVKWLSLNFADSLDPKIKNSLIFKNELGENIVRWILAPTELEIGPMGSSNNKYNDEIINFIRTRGGDTTLHHYFVGYPTASSTYLAEDPNSKMIFFVKSSNARAPIGLWLSKPRQIWEASDARLINDYLVGLQQVKPFKYFTFLQESASLQLPELDRSVIIRDAAGMVPGRKQFRYLPAFSVTDEVVGREIALKNGFDDPEKFWSEHLPKILAAATVELSLRTGLHLDSPHGQNYLFEMDENMRLTGRLVFRDLADMYIERSFFRLYKDRYNLKNFTQIKNIKESKELSFVVSPLSTAGGGWATSLYNHAWLPAQEEVLDRWQRVYTAEAERIFKEITGIDPLTLPNEYEIKYPGHKYKRTFKEGMSYSIRFDPTEKIWVEYFSKLKNQSDVHTRSRQPLSCHWLFNY